MSDEYIAGLHRKLDVLGLCVGLSRLSHDDAYFVKEAQAKLQEAIKSQRRCHELIAQYEELKEEEAKLFSDLQLQLQLAECMKKFVDDLPAAAPAQQATAARQKGGALQAGVATSVAYLTEDEFARVPKYMRGRFTLAGLNKLVDVFNRALSSKYALLSLPKTRLKDSQWKQVATYRQQETHETKGVRFLTDADLTKGPSAAFESSRAVSNFVVLMRHCGRLREIRGPQRIVRYVVV
ncbi:hypothetical protein V5799_022162 [Amblyomma americanum]|uniref:SKA complex subunit 1 n=1 Tax=Amblyomma americanum TaxID=6943 RepID=A0AAQ4FNN0_AMBAM